MHHQEQWTHAHQRVRTFSRTVSREDGTSMEVIRTKETEEGAKVSIELSRSVKKEVIDLEEKYHAGVDSIFNLIFLCGYS